MEADLKARVALCAALLAACSPRAKPSGLMPWPSEPRPAADTLRAQSRLATLHARFAEPASEDRPGVYWAWNGDLDPAEMDRQLADMSSAGLGSVALFPYKGLAQPYLSDAWFDRVRTAAALCSTHGLGLWVIDEGSFPSGFANGAVTDAHPELRQQLIAEAHRATVTDAPFAFDSTETVVAVVAWRSAQPGETWSDVSLALDWQDGGVRWSADGGPWQVAVYAQRPAGVLGYNIETGGAVAGHSYLPDYLNPEATRRFIEVTHARYEAAVGFDGGAFKGFISDESAVTARVWTPALLGRVGATRLPLLFEPQLDPEGPAALARYREAWTQLFAESFHRPLATWARARGLQTLFQPDRDDAPVETMLGGSGDLFRIQREHSMPSIDAIARQIWFGATNDYPKLAASIAHGQGHSRVMSEQYGVYGFGLTPAQAKWVADYQLARGVTWFFHHLYSYSSEGFRRYHVPPDFSAANTAFHPHLRALDDYLARMRVLLTAGAPDPRVALPFPREAIWASDLAALPAAERLARQLLEAQVDFEWVDSDTPDAGLAPFDVTLKSVALEPASTFVRALPRRLDGADALLLFNEGAARYDGVARLPARSCVERWDAVDGRAWDVTLDEAGDVPLHLDPGATVALVVFSACDGATRAAAPQPGPAFLISGPWSEPTWPADFSGTATYSVDFELPDDGRWRLDLGTVRYTAEVTLNGQPAGVARWAPYALEVTGRRGTNHLSVAVTNTLANALLSDAALAEAADAGWLDGTYLPTYRAFDEEMKPSGLAGPVTLQRL